MKLPTFRTVFILTVIVLLAIFCADGCASTPTKVETKLFDITTNTVVVLKTNTIWKTNVEIQQVQQIVPTPSGSVTNVFFFTNVAAIPIQVPTTNVTQNYNYTPNQNAAEIKEGGTAAGNLFGVGGIAGTVLGGIFTAWAAWRSKQNKGMAVALSQIVETGREVLKTLPNGAALDTAYVSWMQKHQAEAGAIQSVMKIVSNVTDNQSAQKAAQEISDTIGFIQSSAVPKAPVAPLI